MRGRPTPRFRTFQVCPKDLPAPLPQVATVENRAHGPVGSADGARGGSPHARHEPTRVHHAARRRGGFFGMSAVGTVESVWRYPVKSMRGEELEEALVGFSGVYGDRLFAFRSTAAPKVFPYLTC